MLLLATDHRPPTTFLRSKTVAEENKQADHGEDQSGTAAGRAAENQTGDPGRTPGTAEGDRETVEEDLRDKEGQEAEG